MNSMLVSAASNFPARLNDRYVLHNVTKSQNDPGVDSIPQLEGNGLERTSPKSLALTVANLAEGTGYLVIAPSMERDVDYYGTFTPDTLPTLVLRLKASPYWQVWYENYDTIIFRAWPQGRPAEKTAHREVQ